MNKSVLIRGARQLLTLHGPSGPRRGADLNNLGIISDGAMLIVNGVIRAVGSSRRIENLAEARNAEEIDAHGKVVLPGFVDSHTHLISGPTRFPDSEVGPEFSSIFKGIQDVPGRTLEIQAWRIIQECIRQGTTTLEAKSGYGINEPGELKILRAQVALNTRLNVLVSTFMGARSSLPPNYDLDLDQYADWLAVEMLPMIHKRKLAEFVDVFCDEGMFDIRQARRILMAARELGFGLKMHAGQFSSRGGVRLAVELGAVTVDHLTHLDPGDAGVLAQSATIATLLPGPVFYMDTHRHANARAFIDRGVAVALATNYNPDTCPTHNMQMILCLACRKMEMTPAEAISAATINGAHALRRGGQIGSLEAGKYGDVIILSVPDYREISYHFGVNLVEMTIKRGVVICRASEVMCPTH